MQGVHHNLDFQNALKFIKKDSAPRCHIQGSTQVTGNYRQHVKNQVTSDSFATLYTAVVSCVHKATVAQSLKKFPTLMEPEVSLPC
jgi:hypothetical protein